MADRDSRAIARSLVFLGLTVAFSAVVLAVSFSSVGFFFPLLGFMVLAYVAWTIFF
jgi:hypothetical protein